MNIVPVSDWFYLHNAAPNERQRLSRVAFWRVAAGEGASVRVAGILNESSDGAAVLVQADPQGGVYLHRDDLQRGHMHLLADMKDRITPAPPAIAPPGVITPPSKTAGAAERPVGGAISNVHTLDTRSMRHPKSNQDD